MSTQAPTFTQPLQSVVALEGSAATFEAQVSGKRHEVVCSEWQIPAVEANSPLVVSMIKGWWRHLLPRN